jgi:hypothetical protein
MFNYRVRWDVREVKINLNVFETERIEEVWTSLTDT